MLEFFTENVEMPTLDFSKIERWVEMVAKDHGYEVGNLTYCFCDDQYILDTNRKFLNHDYFTDIITFDYTRRGRVGGDMVISLDTVRTNAEDLNVSYMQELLRVIIHGVLHLCGINDKGPGEREIMEKAENRALRFWQEMGKSEI
ncbi:MAG: rRNA maturation RNase YbeY [Muribaculaceae bacterium]|nr:rRNA maturation RNase YbeY [Muribaculaceae bacterium]